jgi:hypothetical protein
MVAGVVVSSTAMPSEPSGEPPPIRRLIFSASARPTISFCLAPAFTVTVSKKACDVGAKPSFASPAARTTARRCTVRAMCVSPSGP